MNDSDSTGHRSLSPARHRGSPIETGISISSLTGLPSPSSRVYQPAGGEWDALDVPTFPAYTHTAQGARPTLFCPITCPKVRVHHRDGAGKHAENVFIGRLRIDRRGNRIRARCEDRHRSDPGRRIHRRLFGSSRGRSGGIDHLDFAGDDQWRYHGIHGCKP